MGVGSVGGWACGGECAVPWCHRLPYRPSRRTPAVLEPSQVRRSLKPRLARARPWSCACGLAEVLRPYL